MHQAEDIPADLAALVRLGTVLSVDLAAARCVVRYGDPDDDEPAQTPPIRWLAMRAGETRTWSAPSVGEQVLLLSPDGQLGSSVALMGLVQDAYPALGNGLVEMIEFADGAQITYDPEGHRLRAVLPAGGTAEVEAPGGITLRGDVTIEGNVDITGTVQADQDVLAGGISLKTHVHGGVQAGGGMTSPAQ